MLLLLLGWAQATTTTTNLPSYGDVVNLRSRNPSFAPKTALFKSKAPSFTGKSPIGGRH